MPGPPPPLRWKLLLQDGFWKSSVAGVSAVIVSNRSNTLAECKASCAASTHDSDYTCMGISWSQLRPGMTPSPATPACDVSPESDCNCGPGRFAQCPCQHYLSIDMSNQRGGSDTRPRQANGTEQWLLVGRRVRTRHDFAAAVAPSRPPEVVGNGGRVTPIRWNTTTTFPYGRSVSMRMGWAAKSVTAVSVNVRLRIPSWMEGRGNLGIKLNGAPLARGVPGTFLEIDRRWANGDTLSFLLPEVYRLMAYSGTDEIAGFVGRRYALLVGPVVLACSNISNASSPLQTTWSREAGRPEDSLSNAVMIPHAASNATVSEWLVPTAGRPLHYTVKGAPDVELLPLWELPELRRFTTFPVFARPVAKSDPTSGAGADSSGLP